MWINLKTELFMAVEKEAWEPLLEIFNPAFMKLRKKNEMNYLS